MMHLCNVPAFMGYKPLEEKLSGMKARRPDMAKLRFRQTHIGNVMKALAKSFSTSFPKDAWTEKEQISGVP